MSNGHVEVKISHDSGIQDPRLEIWRFENIKSDTAISGPLEPEHESIRRAHSSSRFLS